jgi:hypothetical protein
MLKLQKKRQPTPALCRVENTRKSRTRNGHTSGTLTCARVSQGRR